MPLEEEKGLARPLSTPTHIPLHVEVEAGRRPGSVEQGAPVQEPEAQFTSRPHSDMPCDPEQVTSLLWASVSLSDVGLSGRLEESLIRSLAQGRTLDIGMS